MKNVSSKLMASALLMIFLVASFSNWVSSSAAVLQEASQTSTDKAVRKLRARPGPPARRKRKPWMPPAPKPNNLHHQFMPPAPPSPPPY
ncbi:hypothetical protein vseg_017048 [Gypsophila vaccaria]